MSLVSGSGTYSGDAFEMLVLCTVPNGLAVAERRISCDAEAQQKGRQDTGVYKHIVHFS
jgi:hypothetical protein